MRNDVGERLVSALRQFLGEGVPKNGSCGLAVGLDVLSCASPVISTQSFPTYRDIQHVVFNRNACQYLRDAVDICYLAHLHYRSDRICVRYL